MCVKITLQGCWDQLGIDLFWGFVAASAAHCGTQGAMPATVCLDHHKSAPSPKAAMLTVRHQIQLAPPVIAVCQHGEFISRSERASGGCVRLCIVHQAGHRDGRWWPTPHIAPAGAIVALLTVYQATLSSKVVLSDTNYRRPAAASSLSRVTAHGCGPRC